MYTEEDLTSAVAAGVLTQESVAALRAHVAKTSSSHSVDEEHFRLATSFNDVFVVIACSLLLIAVGWIGGTWASSLGAALAGLTSWALAEFFVQKRRMALPAIVLTLAFVGTAMATVSYLLDPSLGDPSYVWPTAVGALAAWLHWKRFQVPICVAAGAASLVGFVASILFAWLPELKAWEMPIAFVAGLSVFIAAMRWDASDPQRLKRQSDVAFWLHLLAAPLMVHPIFSALQVFDAQTSWQQAAAVVVLYVFIAFVSLCIDRRALMVSALLYVLVTFSALLKQVGVADLNFAITALFIGATLLMLSVYWHQSRAWVLKWIPADLRLRLARPAA